MTYILGINFLHSDSSACLFKDGHLICAIEEERFTRIKHTMAFPLEAINFCLKSENLDISMINVITINSNPISSMLRKILFILKNPISITIAFNSISNSKKKLDLKNYISKIDSKNEFNGSIKYIDHHESHIASSLFFNNFNECVNLSIDGFGDFASCAWGYSIENNIKLDKKIYFPHSLGIFYQAMTQYLGFKSYGDEYKVMGLSSYGEPKYVNEVSKMIKKDKEGFKLNLDYFLHHKKSILSTSNDQAIYKNLYSKKF